MQSIVRRSQAMRSSIMSARTFWGASWTSNWSKTLVPERAEATRNLRRKLLWVFGSPVMKFTPPF